jgi:hypothetical protein
MGVGCPPGIRTPIGCSRGSCPTIERGGNNALTSGHRRGARQRSRRNHTNLSIISRFAARVKRVSTRSRVRPAGRVLARRRCCCGFASGRGTEPSAALSAWRSLCSCSSCSRWFRSATTCSRFKIRRRWTAAQDATMLWPAQPRLCRPSSLRSYPLLRTFHPAFCDFARLAKSLSLPWRMPPSASLPIDLRRQCEPLLSS